MIEIMLLEIIQPFLHVLPFLYHYQAASYHHDFLIYPELHRVANLCEKRTVSLHDRHTKPYF